MKSGKLTMRIGEGLGEILLDIAQDNIRHGNIEKGLKAYTDSLQGFTKEYALMCLKNKAILKVDEENQMVDLIDDDEQLLKDNQCHIYLWNDIIKDYITTLDSLRDKRLDIMDKFNRYYKGNIEDYSINEMMLRYFNEEQLKDIGIHTIAARLLASPDCKIHNDQYSNPQSLWDKKADSIEYEDPENPNEEITKYERILYYTVEYLKVIKFMQKEFCKFDKLYHFLVENEFINKIPYIELNVENICDIFKEYSNTRHGYDHVLCDEELKKYKEQLYSDILHTTWGREYLTNGVLLKDIMDGYDAGWLSPDGEFYGGNGETSSMIHMNIAEDIFNSPCNKYYMMMIKDGVQILGGTNSPEQWLQRNGWIKIHHNDIYGSFIGERDPKKRTKEFPYHYCPTKIQIKMICEYVDKFYKGKFYTEANCFGRDRHPDPYSTYKVKQMDEFKLHEIFRL